MEELFCPVHKDVQAEIIKIKEKQDARRCQSHEAQLNNLVDSLDETKGVNKEQWAEINKLKVMVYTGAGGAGVLAFLGSIIGAWLTKGH